MRTQECTRCGAPVERTRGTRCEAHAGLYHVVSLAQAGGGQRVIYATDGLTAIHAADDVDANPSSVDALTVWYPGRIVIRDE